MSEKPIGPLRQPHDRRHEPAELRFFFTITLDRPEMARRLTSRASRAIPVVLSPEVARLQIRSVASARPPAWSWLAGRMEQIAASVVAPKQRGGSTRRFTGLFSAAI
jgi:hypothetical protein